MVLGGFTRCGDEAVVRALLLDRLGDLGVPVVGGAPVGHDEPLRAELIAFLDAVRTGNVPAVSGDEGVASLEIAGRSLGLSPSKCSETVRRAASSYRRAMAQFAALTDLDLWSVRLDADALEAWVGAEAKASVLAALVSWPMLTAMAVPASLCSKRVSKGPSPCSRSRLPESWAAVSSTATD